MTLWLLLTALKNANLQLLLASSHMTFKFVISQNQIELLSLTLSMGMFKILQQF